MRTSKKVVRVCAYAGMSLIALVAVAVGSGNSGVNAEGDMAQAIAEAYDRGYSAGYEAGRRAGGGGTGGSTGQIGSGGTVGHIDPRLWTFKDGSNIFYMDGTIAGTDGKSAPAWDLVVTDTATGDVVKRITTRDAEDILIQGQEDANQNLQYNLNVTGLSEESLKALADSVEFRAQAGGVEER